MPIHTIDRVKQTVKERFPSLWVHWQIARHPRSAEAERWLVKNIVRHRDVTVDVGAHFGLYTRTLARLSSKVHAFEPSSAMASILRQTSAPNVIIYDTALSDRDGYGELQIPRSGDRLAYGLASLEANTALGKDVVAAAVRLARLDSIVQDDIAFVKIDAEGHELKVLCGSLATIERCRPAFLVESEERHRSGTIAGLFDFFLTRDYEGYFLRGQDIVSIDLFNPLRDQDESVLMSDGGRQTGRYYINNFFFLPREQNGRRVLMGK